MRCCRSRPHATLKFAWAPDAAGRLPALARAGLVSICGDDTQCATATDPTFLLSASAFGPIEVSYQYDPKAQSFVAVLSCSREHAESAYHPSGTCKMGAKDDPTAVVDSDCKVIGVERLRVADSSIFPLIPNGNLNAPSLMTGEKAADHILGKTPLAPSNQTPWIHPEWQTAQR